MNARTPLNAMRGLLVRMTPELADAIQLGWIDQEDAAGVFEVESRGDGKLKLCGSSAVAMATGLNWYLKHLCKQHISWCGTRTTRGATDLTAVPGGRLRMVLPHSRVVYMNYCTFSYSASWWDWSRWEWEIDFMAMNGVNMPLAMVGIEGVWYHSLLRMGLTDEESRAFLAGPAFLSWQWMANLDGHGGPLPKSWIDSHVELGQKIMGRMRDLGMNPIQQGFSGHVPAIFTAKFPRAAIVRKEPWCNFPGTYQLDPVDPLFPHFGRIFMEEQKRLFGLHGHYAADPFHESVPPKPGNDYLREVGRVIHRLFDSEDPGATWVMQSWSIQKEIACSVPQGKLLVLDLDGKRWRETNGFWGHDFIVGELHNFGGRTNLHGDLAHIASNPFMRAREEYPRASGMGLFMEGIAQNPVFYDLVFDMVWRSHAVDIVVWIQEYAGRRYGVGGGPALQAWEILLKTAYGEGTNAVESSSIVAARPALAVKKSGPNEGFILRYPPRELAGAWRLLLEAGHECRRSDGYRFDLVDVGRQVLSNLGQSLHEKVKAAFEKGDRDAFQDASARFLDLLRDLDCLLETRGENRLAEWIASARRWGSNEAERALYAKNAAMLVTLWGPEGNPFIFDYAWREWSGLIRNYYLSRWKRFHCFLQQKLDQREAYLEEDLPLVFGRETWRANAFYSELAEWETAWVNDPVVTADRPAKPEALERSKAVYEKWSPVINEAMR